MPADDGLVIREICLLRLHTLLARARADETAYRAYRDRYCDMAKTLEFDGHIACAEATPSRRSVGGMPSLSHSRRDTKLSKLCLGITVNADGSSWK